MLRGDNLTPSAVSPGVLPTLRSLPGETVAGRDVLLPRLLRARHVLSSLSRVRVRRGRRAFLVQRGAGRSFDLAIVGPSGLGRCSGRVFQCPSGGLNDRYTLD